MVELIYVMINEPQEISPVHAQPRPESLSACATLGPLCQSLRLSILLFALASARALRISQAVTPPAHAPRACLACSAEHGLDHLKRDALPPVRLCVTVALVRWDHHLEGDAIPHTQTTVTGMSAGSAVGSPSKERPAAGRGGVRTWSPSMAHPAAVMALAASAPVSPRELSTNALGAPAQPREPRTHEVT